MVLVIFVLYSMDKVFVKLPVLLVELIVIATQQPILIVQLFKDVLLQRQQVILVKQRVQQMEGNHALVELREP